MMTELIFTLPGLPALMLMLGVTAVPALESSTMPFEFDYVNGERLHADDFESGLGQWFHEGAGTITATNGAMRLHGTHDSQGCMAFFRPTLPDQVAIEYDITVRRQRGLIINYLAIRGLKGEDLIEDRDTLEPRTGGMVSYYSRVWGLQSYHVSFSRFNDQGVHSGTSNWRRNPGALLMAHGVDLVSEIDRTYHVRVIKDGGHCAFLVNGENGLGFVDRDKSRGPIPDTGKFGFRLVGPDVMAEIDNLVVYRIKENSKVWLDVSDRDPRQKPTR